MKEKFSSDQSRPAPLAGKRQIPKRELGTQQHPLSSTQFEQPANSVIDGPAPRIIQRTRGSYELAGLGKVLARSLARLDLKG
jgi:hypothetical protein